MTATPSAPSLEQPFTASSPWNTALGADAQYEATTGAETADLRSNAAPWIGGDATGVYQATASDPLATWTFDSSEGFGNGGAGSIQIQTPSNIQFLGGTDQWAIIASADGKSYYETWLGSYNAATNTYHAGYLVENSIGGTGFATVAGASAGIRAAGASLLGGLVRTGELDNLNIPHAIAMAIATTQAKAGNSIASQYVYPATNADSNSLTAYSGVIPIGAQFAIPQNIDLSTIGLKSPEGLALAKAFQTYGGYVVDTAGAGTDDLAYLQAGVTTQQYYALLQDIGTIRSYLSLVTDPGTGLVSSQDVYSASGDFIGTKSLYADVAAQSYSGYEDDYNGGGSLTRVDYTGVAGQPYSSYEHDYVDARLVSSRYDYTTAPPGSAYSSYEKDYNSSGAYVGENLFYTGITGKSYTGHAQDINANGHLRREAFTGIAGQPYTATSDRYDKSGALMNVTYDYTNVAGQNYYADQVHDSPSGAKLAVTEDLNSGGRQVTGFANDVRFLLRPGDAEITGGGSNETFVFKPIFGADTITDFASHDTGVTHDTIALSTADFANFAAVIAGATNSGSNAIITAHDGQTLTLDGLNTTTLAGLSADFKFHT